MATSDQRQRRFIHMDERSLSIIVHSLFSAWMLAFLFEGQILYLLADFYGLSPAVMVFMGVAGVFSGLLLGGLFMKSKRGARVLFLWSYPFFITISLLFFFPPSGLWTIAIAVGSLLAGGCVAAWGYFLKTSTPRKERIKTVADMLVLSNILMILLNLTAFHISPSAALALSVLMLGGAFLLALRLPFGDDLAQATSEHKDSSMSIVKILVFLCLFITIITINSGIMYGVIAPAFGHLQWLTSWYWAIPYIAALITVRSLPRKVNRTYILYLAIAMIGLSFIGFMSLSRSVISYLVINTLMLGAFGVYDLFWWSILGEMLDFHNNPAKILGIGLSANVLGILLGELTGRAVSLANLRSLHPTLLALTVVCVTLALLPPLHKHLSSLLTDHVYLTEYSRAEGKTSETHNSAMFASLSKRESQVASLLLQGKTYRVIANELSVSENTVKYYVKNIYSKYDIQSRAELIDIFLDKR